MFSMSLLSRSALHCAIFPNRSESVSLVVATIGEAEEVELSSDPDDSPPGDPFLFFVRSFLILVKSTCGNTYSNSGSSDRPPRLTGSFAFFAAFLAPCGGVGLTLDGSSMISPVLPLGLGGGGCLLGSVGLSDVDDFAEVAGLRGGGVIGLGIRLVGGDGVGEGGRGRAPRDDFGGGDAGFDDAVLARERGTENERDLDTFHSQCELISN